MIHVFPLVSTLAPDLMKLCGEGRQRNKVRLIVSLHYSTLLMLHLSYTRHTQWASHNDMSYNNTEQKEKKMPKKN